MKLATTLMAGALVVGFVLPAAAQEEYYVVQNSGTKTCTITTQRPTGTEYTMVGPTGTIYKTRVQAEDAMKTIKVCHNE